MYGKLLIQKYIANGCYPMCLSIPKVLYGKGLVNGLFLGWNNFEAMRRLDNFKCL